MHGQTFSKILASEEKATTTEMSLNDKECHFLCAEDGRVFVWGGSGEGQLGMGEETEIPVPKELDIGQRVTCIACGYYHSALVTGE